MKNKSDMTKNEKRIAAFFIYFVCWFLLGDRFHDLVGFALVVFFSFIIVTACVIAVLSVLFPATYIKKVKPFLNRIGVNVELPINKYPVSNEQVLEKRRIILTFVLCISLATTFAFFLYRVGVDFFLTNQ